MIKKNLNRVLNPDQFELLKPKAHELVWAGSVTRNVRRNADLVIAIFAWCKSFGGLTMVVTPLTFIGEEPHMYKRYRSIWLCPFLPKFSKGGGSFDC